jgi:hypothetical protein
MRQRMMPNLFDNIHLNGLHSNDLEQADQSQQISFSAGIKTHPSESLA